jgi:hypothetical protein
MLSGFLLKAINRTSTNEKGILGHERGRSESVVVSVVNSAFPLFLCRPPKIAIVWGAPPAQCWSRPLGQHQRGSTGRCCGVGGTRSCGPPSPRKASSRRCVTRTASSPLSSKLVLCLAVVRCIPAWSSCSWTLVFVDYSLLPSPRYPVHSQSWLRGIDRHCDVAVGILIGGYSPHMHE